MIMEDGEPGWRRSLSDAVDQRGLNCHGQISQPEAARCSGQARKNGFLKIRQRGSHQQFKHPDGRQTTVPFIWPRYIPYFGKTIAKDIGLTVPEFYQEVAGVLSGKVWINQRV
jgi:predicted RNA binding protein YcfA (HicA-like mRNA interferase family)